MSLPFPPLNETIFYEAFFGPHLVSVKEIGVGIMSFTVLALAIVYCAAGFVALTAFRRNGIAFFFPLFFMLFGAAIGVVMGLFVGLSVAAAYTTGNFPMPRWTAAIFGGSTAVIYLCLSTGRIMAVQ